MNPTELTIKRIIQRYHDKEISAEQAVEFVERTITPLAFCDKCRRPFSFQEAKAGFTTCEHCDAQANLERIARRNSGLTGSRA